MADEKPGSGTAKQPPVRLRLSGQDQPLGHRPDDLNAWDLKYGMGILAVKSLQTSTLIIPFTQMDNNSLIALMDSGVITMMTGGAFDEGVDAGVTAQGTALLFRFHTGAGWGDWIFNHGSAVSNYASKLGAVLNFLDVGVRARLKNEVRAAWKSPNPLVDDAAIAAAQFKATSSDTSPFFGGMLAGFIGGTQGFKLDMTGFSVDPVAATFSYGINAEFYDHFGVDDSDVNRTNRDGSRDAKTVFISTALAPWFVLQHFRAGVRFRPFRTVTKIKFGPFTEQI